MGSINCQILELFSSSNCKLASPSSVTTRHSSNKFGSALAAPSGGFAFLLRASAIFERARMALGLSSVGTSLENFRKLDDTLILPPAAIVDSVSRYGWMSPDDCLVTEVADRDGNGIVWGGGSFRLLLFHPFQRFHAGKLVEIAIEGLFA